MGFNSFDYKKMNDGAALLLEGMGIDWKNNENFQETPDRVAKAFKEFTTGLHQDLPQVKTFKTTYTGIVFFKSVQAIGLCPHHLLPIYYTISFGYIPKGKVLGLSKVPRIIKHLAARPVLQEDLTKEINDYFQKLLTPKGVAVLVSGTHGCMKYRGVKEAEEVKTVELSGEFKKDSSMKDEFYLLIEK